MLRLLIYPFALAILVAAAGPGQATPREIKIDEESLGTVTVLAPTQEPTQFVALLSDSDGLTPALRQTGEALAKSGAAVALIDTPRLIDGLAKGDEEDCHYAFGDIEDAARTAQRALGMRNWHWPVMLGLGETGGTLAYLAIAQAPLNTAAGAVSLGFSPRFASKLAMCEGAPASKMAVGQWSYRPMKALPGRWTLISSAALDATAKTFLEASPGTSSKLVPGEDAARLDAAIAEALAIGAPPAEELGDLPVVELPTDGPPAGLAIFLSGDGGWRDIDKTIGEMLRDQGVAVVGVDSLRYFWSTKEPEVIAADLERIVAHYTKLWGAKRVAIIGYSMGADVIPFAWRKLSERTQKKLSLVALIGLEPTADFEISVAGWLGVASSSDVDLRPFIPSLPFDKTVCFFGHDEVADGDTACTLPEMSRATLVERPGGHHFDGDYSPVARMIVQRLVAAPPPRAL
jgi:type IV secretory pathway VirJ component